MKRRAQLALVGALLGALGCSADEPPLEPTGGPPTGLTRAQWGELLYTEHTCAACHPINGARGVGGRLDHRFGFEAVIEAADGTEGIEVAFDEDYVRESIVDPEAKRAEGFEATMPSYADVLDEQQVEALVAFVASLR